MIRSQPRKKKTPSLLHSHLQPLPKGETNQKPTKKNQQREKNPKLPFFSLPHSPFSTTQQPTADQRNPYQPKLTSVLFSPTLSVTAPHTIEKPANPKSEPLTPVRPHSLPH